MNPLSPVPPLPHQSPAISRVQRVLAARPPVFGLVTALLLTLLVTVSTPLHAAPSVVVAPPKVDFGDVRQHQHLKQTLEIANHGDEPLELTNIKTSCGCTAALAAETMIAPGGTTQLDVTFATESKAGSQMKTVVIETNDPANRHVIIRVLANILTDFSVNPPMLSFGRIAPRATPAPTLLLAITHHTGEARAVKNLVYDKTHYTVEIVPPANDAERGTLHLSVTVKPDLPLSRLADLLRVEWEDATLEPTEIPVFAEISGDLQVTPDTLFFGGGESQAQEPRRFEFVSASGKPFTIREWQGVPDCLKLTVVARDGGGYVVTATLDTAHAPEQLRTTIKALTDSPEQPTVAIPLLIFQPPATANAPRP